MLATMRTYDWAACFARFVIDGLSNASPIQRTVLTHGSQHISSQRFWILQRITETAQERHPKRVPSPQNIGEAVLRELAEQFSGGLQDRILKIIVTRDFEE